MISKIDKNADRIKRHARVRAKISGTPEKPRLSVYRSLSHIYAQIIDDVAGNTLVAASTVEKDIAKLADILGHSSIDTTRIYIMTTGTEHRRKIERLGLIV